MAKTNILKKSGKTYIFSHKGIGGESGITVTPLTVTENGTYTSGSGQAYSPVTVNVPSSIGGELFCWTYTDENTGNTYYAYTASPNPSVRDAVYIAGGEAGGGLSPLGEGYEVYSFTDGKLVIAESYDHEPISEDEYTRDNTYDIDLGELEVETNRTYSITQNGTIVINPSSGNDVMEKVTATINVVSAEIEANKAVTIDASSYSAPVEITPTSGKDGMAKTTVTLSNIPVESDIETEKTVSITQNGTYTINPTTGKDAMAKVTATVSVATASVEGTNLILSSGSVSGNTLNL